MLKYIYTLIVILLIILFCHRANSAEYNKYHCDVKFTKPVSEVHMELLDTGEGKFLQICDDGSCQRITMYKEEINASQE